MNQSRNRFYGRCLTVLALFLTIGLAPGWAQSPRHVPGRLLVKFRRDVAPDKARGVLASFQAREDRELPELGIKVIALPPNASETALERAFRGRAEVEFAEVDRILPPDAVTPNDPLYSSQWHLPKIAAPDAWSVTSGTSGITIAILDTGVDGCRLRQQRDGRRFGGMVLPDHAGSHIGHEWLRQLLGHRQRAGLGG